MKYYALIGDYIYVFPGNYAVARVVYAETGEIIDIIPLI